MSAPGVSPDDVQVSGTGGGIALKRVGPGQYIATVTVQAEVRIQVDHGTTQTTFRYRVKRIPDPVPRLGVNRGGPIGVAEFKAQGGLSAFLADFDFDADCSVQRYDLVYLARRQDPVVSINAGPRYNAKPKQLVSQAMPGDVYLFTRIRAKCPGDPAGRPLGSIAFTIR